MVTVLLTVYYQTIFEVNIFLQMADGEYRLANIIVQN